MQNLTVHFVCRLSEFWKERFRDMVRALEAGYECLGIVDDAGNEVTLQEDVVWSICAFLSEDDLEANVQYHVVWGD